MVYTMVDMVWLLPAAFVVGMLIGSVGIGGVLLIPALTAFAGLGLHEAMATALFTFIFTGITGTVMFQRHGSIDWRITIPVCAGTVVFAFFGAWVNSVTTAGALAVVLAGVIVFAGVYTLIIWRAPRHPVFHQHGRVQCMLLLAVGAASGFGSGLTGVGGPVISVPLMVLLGFPALTTIGTSQVIQIIAAISGSLGNFQFGTIHFRIAAIVTLLEIAGVFAGARIVHAVNAASLRKFVAVLCITVGAVLLGRALGS